MLDFVFGIFVFRFFVIFIFDFWNAEWWRRQILQIKRTLDFSLLFPFRFKHEYLQLALQIASGAEQRQITQTI